MAARRDEGTNLKSGGEKPIVTHASNFLEHENVARPRIQPSKKPSKTKIIARIRNNPRLPSRLRYFWTPNDPSERVAAGEERSLPQLQQPSPRPTPSSEASRQAHVNQVPSLSVRSESGESEGDGSDEPALDEPVYVVPDSLQGTISPVPMPINSNHMQWKDLPNTRVPLPDDPTVKITGFDNILVTTISQDNGRPHNEPAKVLDCRLHPNGTYLLLVSWWFERRLLLRSIVGYKRYLDRKWPKDAPYQYILGCHFDVITNDAIVEKMLEDERFCKSMIYGGMYHDCELFSDVPDEVERDGFIRKGGNKDIRLEKERQQKSLYRLLFPSL